MIAWNARVSKDPSQAPAWLDTVQVNRFQGSYNPCPVETTTLAHALAQIRSDRYQQQIECLRATLTTHGKGIYNHYKKMLDAYSFAGTFSPQRRKEYLQAHSGIVHLDYDGIADVQDMLEVLCVVPALTYAFVSPSGCGLKIGVRVLPVADDLSYKHAWQCVADTIEQAYGFVADPSGKDISRLCFVSYDPHCYINDAPDIFPVPLMERPAPHPATPAALSAPLATDRRQQYVDQAVTRAVKLIETSYPALPGIPGNRHHSRLKAARLLGGYVGGGLLTYEHAYALLESAVIWHTIHLSQSMRTIAAGLQYGMKTPVSYDQLEAERLRWCEAHGYTPRRGEGN
jgi:VirE-like protein